MRPLKPVSAGARILLGAGFFAVFIGAWAFRKWRARRMSPIGK